MRAGTTNGTLYRNLINAYQIHSGLSLPVLEDTRPIPWSSPGWLSSIRQFLYTTSTQIRICDPWTPRPQQHNDRNIMEDAHSLLPTINLRALNNVRLYLRVTYLSEISDACGQFIRTDNLTDMQQSTASTLKWPYQIPPLEANWKLWTCVICSLYTKPNSNMLIHKLGPWYHDHVLQHWTWNWRIDPGTHVLYQRIGCR